MVVLRLPQWIMVRQVVLCIVPITPVEMIRIYYLLLPV